MIAGATAYYLRLSVPLDLPFFFLRLRVLRTVIFAIIDIAVLSNVVSYARLTVNSNRFIAYIFVLVQIKKEAHNYKQY